MHYSSCGVTGSNVTCSPSCYLSRSPVLALANNKVTEVTGKFRGKNSIPREHAHEKNRFDSDIAVTSVTPVTYYLMNTENTDSKEVTANLSRCNFWCYPVFSLMHDLIGQFFGSDGLFNKKTAFSGVSRIVNAHKHHKEGLQWTR